ncbi:MAG: hypothetical protein N2515_02080 [Deltaproteobacteria bacterium]|nr:hypothetical protein [Deltaproteobacteria bacterium]
MGESGQKLEVHQKICPFCKESFEEGIERCPAHDLKLMVCEEEGQGECQWGWAQKEMKRTFWDRMVIGVAGLGMWVGFLMPFVKVEKLGQERVFTFFGAASTRAPNLWSLPLGGIFLLSVAIRFQRIQVMRSLWLGTVMACLFPLISVGYSLHRVIRAAELQSGVHVSAAWGIGVVVCACLLGLLVAWRYSKDQA